MGLRVLTNVQSLAAQRNLGINSDLQKNSLEKLASGSRITRAADDAAGLAIGEKMRAQIRSIRQNIRNANDGVSIIQTTEGSLNEASNVLVRFRELAIQGASDTVGDQERGFINKEVDQLKQEIDRIAVSTEFNGRHLLRLVSGEPNLIEIQIADNNNPEQDRLAFDAEKLNTSAETLGIADVGTLTKEQAQNSIAAIDHGILVLSENRATLGAFQNRLTSAISNMQIYDENLSAARSRIMDLDIAEGTANLTKYNILSQVGTSVLSQANSNNAQALKLIG